MNVMFCRNIDISKDIGLGEFNMGQMNLYDYLHKENDPLYKGLAELKAGKTVTISDIEVTLNVFGVYEVSHDQVHDAFSSIEECYRFLNKLFNDIQLSNT